MGSSKDKRIVFDNSGRLLDGLARELKLSLTYIARSAEYHGGKSAQNKHALGGIEKSASDSLRLIDSYLLCAQTEYGQQLLPMEPIGPGSALYEVVQNLSLYSGKLTIKTDYNEPVMANKKALVSALYSLVKLVESSIGEDGHRVFLVSQKRRGKDLSVGVYAKGFNTTPSEIQRSAELLGQSDMSLSNQTFTSGVDLAIAGQLASSMGGHLSSAKYKGRGGIALNLLKSDQLSLVGK